MVSPRLFCENEFQKIGYGTKVHLYTVWHARHNGSTVPALKAHGMRGGNSKSIYLHRTKCICSAYISYYCILLSPPTQAHCHHL